MRIRTLTMAAALAWLPQAAAAAGDARDQLAEQLPQWLEQSGTPSAAVALVEDGRLRWTLVEGQQAEGVAASGDTLYNVASLTKPVTAEVVLRAASRDLIGLDAPMDAHWADPDLASDPRRTALTARLCLSHQCGFPNWRRETDGTLRIQWRPGTRAAYSGEGYEYTARYLEAATGQSLEALAQRLLFAPAGMQETAYTRRPGFESRVAVPRGPDGSSGAPDLRSEASAADDLHTTIGDFGRFAASVLRGDGLASALADARWEIAHDLAGHVCAPGRLQGDECPVRMGFALGWVRFETASDTVYFHGGGDWGERAFVLLVPAQRLGVVVLTNGAGGMAVVRNVVAMLYDNRALDAFLRMQAGG